MTEGMMVFLDFDGVTHTTGKGVLFDPRCMEPLAEAFERVDAQVVIISSWREYMNLDQLRDEVPGFADRVIAASPVDPGYTKSPREWSIREHFHLRGESLDQPWLAIDDNPAWYGQLQGRVIATNPKTGFVGASLTGYMRLVTGLQDQPEGLPPARVRDLPTSHQAPFREYLAGHHAPVLDDPVQDGFYWHDYAAWRQEVNGDREG